MFQKRICTKIVSLLLVIGCLMSEPVLAEKQKEPEAQTLYSKSCAMVDGDSGRLLYGKEAQTALPNASTTKILTCIVAMEQCKPDEVVTFSTKAASQPKVHLGAKKGEQFYMQDLWYGLMLESYNDCAYAIAEHVAGSAEKFAALMNEKAKKIGCTDSHFVTPNGLDAKDEHGEHHTTAYDLCRIMSYCAWKSPVSKQFLEVTQTRSHTFQSLEGTGYAVSNKNALLDMMDHVITGKTGYTSKAGYCYVAALEEGGRHYAIALLACGWPNNKTYKWHDAKLLLNWARQNYYYKELINSDTPIRDIAVKNGLASSVKTKIDDSVGLLLGPDDIINITYNVPGVYPAPVHVNDVVGNVNIYINDSLYTSVPVYADDEVMKKDYWYYLKQLFYKLRFVEIRV